VKVPQSTNFTGRGAYLKKEQKDYIKENIKKTLAQLLLLNITVFGKIIPSTRCTGTQECEMGIKHFISD